MSKNGFRIDGDIISITRSEWDFIAQATVREDYLEEIQSVTWGLNKNRYLYNSKYGYLHSYIMKKWYGEDFCKKTKDMNYVIDHMDNNSTNCCINNLYFLLDRYNKAKGMTLDQDNANKEYIALSIYRDFKTNLFQITIVFNYPATLSVNGFDKPAVVELTYLLYEGDYRKMLIDAENILLEYKEHYTFSPEKLKAIDYHIEGCIGKVLPPAIHEEYLSGKHGHGVAFFDKKAPLNNWTKDTNEKYFIIKDRGNQCYYKFEL